MVLLPAIKAPIAPIVEEIKGHIFPNNNDAPWAKTKGILSIPE